jgi:hypothetical protein
MLLSLSAVGQAAAVQMQMKINGFNGVSRPREESNASNTNNSSNMHDRME